MLVRPTADTPTETISDLLKVGRVLNKCEDGMVFLLTPAGADTIVLSVAWSCYTENKIYSN